MRGADQTQHELFSFRTLGDRIPRDHPLRKLRAVVDSLLRTMDTEFAALYAKTGRGSIPPERLLRASLIPMLCSIRSEPQWVQQIDDNLLYRGFVGLTLDGEVWDHSTFSDNRQRLLNERITRSFFERVLALAEWQQLLSDEHVSVDGTLIRGLGVDEALREEGRRAAADRWGTQPERRFQGRNAQQRHPCIHDRAGRAPLQEARRG